MRGFVWVFWLGILFLCDVVVFVGIRGVLVRVSVWLSVIVFCVRCWGLVLVDLLFGLGFLFLWWVFLVSGCLFCLV